MLFAGIFALYNENDLINMGGDLDGHPIASAKFAQLTWVYVLEDIVQFHIQTFLIRMQRKPITFVQSVSLLLTINALVNTKLQEIIELAPKATKLYFCLCFFFLWIATFMILFLFGALDLISQNFEYVFSSNSYCSLNKTSTLTFFLALLTIILVVSIVYGLAVRSYKRSQQQI